MSLFFFYRIENNKSNKNKFTFYTINHTSTSNIENNYIVPKECFEWLKFFLSFFFLPFI